ncbi:MFS general substrate transporter [Pholiota conissans]|uniref:MFS general substrate transporter n=1 Tax=Pholiota conissans TaxID=109636 RepID=A0A9P6D085_9AGAR|nr:MFS general substrate transporter [Pholiota conissans]
MEALPVLNDEDVDRRVKAIIRKVDWRMLPLLGVLSALSLIDRSNLGLARTAGMDHALHLSIGNRYSVVSLIYFVPVVLLQLPSNLCLRKFGVVNYLSFLVAAWGAVQLSMGFVPAWGYLCLTRVLLGVFEAGFFPAMVYIISTWYTRHEVQKRLAAFYLVGILVGGFSAIFAYVLTLLGGKAGIPAWSWIFIVEGLITIVFGVIAWFFLPSFPDQNTFLSPEDTDIILRRVEKDRGDSLPDTLTKEVIIKHLLDWKLWAIGLMYMCTTMPAYAISYFITIILHGMGWNETASLLLSAPPYIFAALSIMFFAWIADKYRQRAAIIAIQAVITVIGMTMAGYLKSPSGRYAGIFLANAGSAGCIPGILAYSANNIVSHSKRAVATAITVSFGGIGGIFASVVFRQADFPTYHPGIYATIACQLLMLLLLAITTLYYWKQNKSIREGTASGPLEGRPGFFYTL